MPRKLGDYMTNYAYDKIKLVAVQNDNNRYEFKSVIRLDEYDHEIVVTSQLQLDGLHRGFIGDLSYHLRGFCIEDEKKEVPSVTGYREVLLARITVSAYPGSPVEWKYTFLKD